MSQPANEPIVPDVDPTDPNDPTDPTPDPAPEPGNDPAPDPTELPPADLGDAGKKALDAMKAERKAAREEAAAAKAERDALQAKLDGREAEYAAEQKQAAAKAEALKGANERILRSEIKSAAKGVLADPADAFKFLDLSEFAVDDEGDVDEAQIVDALKKLVESKPYLAVQDGKRFEGTGDGGPKGTVGKPQFTDADLKTMTPEQIVQAQTEGRLTTLLGG